MATRNETTTAEGRTPRQQDQTASPTTANEATASAAGTSGVARQDAERQRPVSREAGARGSGMARQQPSAFPSSLATSPGLLAGAFMANPFEFMRRLSADMDRAFDDVGFGRGTLAPLGATSAGRGLAGGGLAGEAAVWAPQIETFRRGNDLVVRADLPGVPKEDIQIEVENGVLTLSGERRQESEERREGFYRSERSYGSFYRAIPLPDDVNEDRIEATYDNGVLELKIPVPEQKEQRGRRIAIR
jgi:HSP20 family protein